MTSGNLQMSEEDSAENIKKFRFSTKSHNTISNTTEEFEIHIPEVSICIFVYVSRLI